ncbi:hypothetical protein DM02DRAFT_523265 [Periconia macrospinosa]|uniref:Aminoglycoside phosphotransferase domain-containing protein n=1 Tax=Periconia macrospinosa TaxID=97972 RepID=A0A2V1DVS4_9PLEO|nr:hypothetical protein DM02DRAFT_523265 [Periconia macrospinosa]
MPIHHCGGGDEDYEPFETYQHKVTQLAGQAFPKAQKITLERVRGGSENRTIGVNVFDSRPNIFVRIWQRILTPCYPTNQNTAKQYILRIPRWKNEFLEQQVAILRVVGSKTSLPVPKVVQYDTTSDNGLKSQYMIQNRIPGRPLKSIINELNPKQLESFLKNIMEITETLAGFHSDTAGEITEENLLLTPQSNVQLGKYFLPPRGWTDHTFPKPRTWPAFPQDTLTLLIEQCERWREYEIHQNEEDLFGYIWDSFSTISTSLQKLGFLDGPFSLVHGDLADHNLLVDVKDENTVNVTGVIEWDYAKFVPKFVAYRAPYWTWLDDNSLSWHHERHVNHEPRTENGRRAKAYFEANASDEWKKFAFAPEAIIARQMFDFMIRGMSGGSWETDLAEDLLRAWDELHPEDKIKTSDPFLDSDYESDSDA